MPVIKSAKAQTETMPLSELVRVQFDFNKSSLQNLDEIARTLGLTRAGVIRAALSLFAEAVAVKIRGGSVRIREKDGSEGPVILPF